MECMTKPEVALPGIEATSLWVRVLTEFEAQEQDGGSTCAAFLRLHPTVLNEGRGFYFCLHMPLPTWWYKLVSIPETWKDKTFFQFQHFWLHVKTQPGRRRRARPAQEDQENTANTRQRDQRRKDNTPTAQTASIISPVNWILSQLAVGAGVCGFKHVRFDTVPLQRLRAVANHPHISMGSNRFPLIPFNSLTTLITLINVACSTRSVDQRPTIR